MNRLEIEQKLVLTKEERRAWVVFDYIASRFARLYGDQAQNTLNIVATVMSTKRVEAAARAMAKAAVHHVVTTICLEYPDKKEMKNINFRWLRTNCLSIYERVRVRYETPSMELFYYNPKFNEIFKNAFINQVSEYLGKSTSEAPYGIWACVWNFDLTND